MMREMERITAFVYEVTMPHEVWNESVEAQLVTYVVEIAGEIIVIQHVPARVNPETGERFFVPETVEQLQALLRAQTEPTKRIQVPVFEFAA